MKKIKKIAIVFSGTRKTDKVLSEAKEIITQANSELVCSVNVNKIRSAMDKYNMNCVSYPSEWSAMEGESYAKQIMESNGSVHLNPVYYRRHNWGVAENSLERFMA